MKTNGTASINSSSYKEPDINSLKKLSQQALADYAITLIEENQKMELVSNATLTKYETLLSVYPNPVIIIDKKGYVSEINQAVVESSGFSRDKILNKHFLKLPFFRLQDLPKYTLLMHRILKGELTVVEDIRWKHKSGEIRYSNAYCKLFYDNKGKTAGFIGVVPDITDTKTSELIKKKTEDEYYDLIEKTQMALLTDDEQGRITSVNARFLNLFEFTEEDIKDFNLSQWVHPEDYPLVLKNHTNRLAGKKALKNYEFRALTKSGKIIWCEVEVISLVENGRNIGSRTYLRDISKRKADKQKIEEQSQLLQSAIENLTDPFYVIDVKDYSIQLANTASGLKKGQIKTKCYELVHNRTTPCEGETQTCTLSQIMKTRKPCTLEHRHYNANGELRHVEIRAYPIFDNKQNITRVIEHTLDITDKKKINEALIREKTQTQAYLDIAAVMLVVLDTAQKVVLCNKEGLKILGYSESELIGKNWFDMVIPERERPMVKQVFDAFVGEKQDAPEYFENYIITKKGEKRLIAWKNSFVRNKEGKIENLISSGEDITWKRQSEEKLKASEKKYQTLFEDHSAPKLIIDANTGAIYDSNKAASDFYGWSKEEFKTLNIRYINNLNEEEFRQRLSQIRKEKKRLFEFQHKLADGTYKNVEVYVGMLMINGREFIHAIIHDISDRKQSELVLNQKHKLDKALAKLFIPLSKENLSIKEIAYAIYKEALAITNSSACYVATIDIKNPDNLIAHTLSELFIDNRCTIVQEENQEIVFSRTKDGKFPALFGFSLNNKISFFTNNAPEHPESKGLPEGHIKIDKFLAVPVLLNEELVGQIALANPEQDYTQNDLDTIEHLAEYMALAIQRHHSSERLRSSEKRFKIVAENSGEWIWEVDAQGLFTYSSPVVSRINGFTPEELVGKMHYFDFYNKEIHEAKMLEAGELFKSKQVFSGIEDRIMHKNGKEVIIETKGIPIISETGELQGYRGATIDITEKKSAEANLIKHARELEAFNELMVDREMRIIEMKEEVNALCKKLNIEERYPENWK